MGQCIHMTSGPVTTCAFAHARLLLAWTLTVSAMLLSGAGWVMPAQASPASFPSGASLASLQAEDFPERHPNRIGGVYDTVDILTTAQEKAIQTDIDRASRLGIEMLVYTRMSEDSAAESQEFANRLNAEWNVESAEGANDGLVYLVTVNPREPETNSVVISAGEAALPIRQLDGDDLQRILETEMAPEVADGEFNTAIQFGLRRVLNAAEYSPPAPEPLSAAQQSLNKAATILGAALLQYAVLGYFVVAIIREQRFTVAPSSRSLAIHAICLSVASVIVGSVASAGRSAFGSLAALATLLLAACLIPILIGVRDRAAAHAGNIHVGRRALRRSPAAGTAHG